VPPLPFPRPRLSLGQLKLTLSPHTPLSPPLSLLSCLRRSPATVLTSALVFIAVVILLHVYGKFTK
jgi:hypothetical protein